MTADNKTFDALTTKFAVTAMGSDHCSLLYRIAFAPRYRRRIFELSGAKQIFKQSAESCSIEKGFELLDIQFQPDCVMLTVKAQPNLSPKDIATQLKIYSTKPLLSGVKELKQASSLWTKHYYAVTCEDKNLSHIPWHEQAAEYVRRQPKRG